jgi:hypothetical protein
MNSLYDVAIRVLSSVIECGYLSQPFRKTEEASRYDFFPDGVC